MKECGAGNLVSKRVFVDHILKVYPSAVKERIQKSRQSMITVYRGLNLLPVSLTSNLKDVNLFFVKNILIEILIM